MRSHQIPHPLPNDVVMLENSAADLRFVSLGKRLGQERMLAMDDDSVALW